MNDTTEKRSVNSWSEGAGLTESQMLQMFRPWTIHMMNRSCATLPRHLFLFYREDMLQNAAMQLVLRWRKYLSKKVDCNFLTYAYRAVKGAIVDTWRNRRTDTVYTVDFISTEEVDIEQSYWIEDQLAAEIDLYNVSKPMEQWEKNFLTLRYYEGEDLKTIGAMGGVSESRACQVQQALLMRMRKEMIC